MLEWGLWTRLGWDRHGGMGFEVNEWSGFKVKVKDKGWKCKKGALESECVLTFEVCKMSLNK